MAEQYYDSDTGNRYLNENNHRNSTMNFSIIHLNIRSISPNIDEFMAYLTTIIMDFDVIGSKSTVIGFKLFLFIEDRKIGSQEI